MSELVQFAVTGGIGVITVQNPPVNALSPGVPEGIVEAIARVAEEGLVEAAVIIGGGRTFVAGADIKEFAKITSRKATCGEGIKPMLMCVENCPKPEIAAIHGTAFGGGLELAMAAHYRVAVRDAQVG